MDHVTHVQIYQPRKLKDHFGDGKKMYPTVNNQRCLEKISICSCILPY